MSGNGVIVGSSCLPLPANPGVVTWHAVEWTEIIIH